MQNAGKDMSQYDREKVMKESYDHTELGILADEMIKDFQKNGSSQAGIFHHLITLPTYHTTALQMSKLEKHF